MSRRRGEVFHSMCGRKALYKTRGKAARAAERTKLRPYRCAFGNHFHLTSDPETELPYLGGRGRRHGPEGQRRHTLKEMANGFAPSR